MAGNGSASTDNRTATGSRALHDLGDFTLTPRVFTITAIALVIGIVASFVAIALLKLIAIFTNLFFFHRLSLANASPSTNTLGVLSVLVPVIGSLIVGAMAWYGSDKIRGHGIPEAIEAILMKGSRIEPKVAVLKPMSAAIAIGSGGPFGAEGPIIMTGGAIGSLVAQFFHLTNAERKTLLVAGAAAGMSATFGAPVASVLLAVELMLFEWKPRSLVPVAFASATACIARCAISGRGVFPFFVPPHHQPFAGAGSISGTALLGVYGGLLVAGVLAAVLASLLTRAVYATEDRFEHLPVSWALWPAIGGLVVGIGGLVFPRGLGVGYDVIGVLVGGGAGFKLVLGVLLVKSIMWAVALGSGTSGGVLAPLLMMGAALGALESHFLPSMGAGYWALVSMGAVMAGAMRAPLTAIVFAIELTWDLNMAVPLIIACTVSYLLTVLVLKRSILTEKVARRGYHLSSEYAVDPLETLFVREVMRENVVRLEPALRRDELPSRIRTGGGLRDQQQLFPVVGDDDRLVGLVSRQDLADWTGHADGPDRLAEIVKADETATVYPDETLKEVVQKMASDGHTRFAVISRGPDPRFAGMVSLGDLLKARTQNLDAEQRRERVLNPRVRRSLHSRNGT